MNNSKEVSAIVETMISLCQGRTAEEVTYREIEEVLGQKEGYCFMFFDHKADMISACVETVADDMIEEMASALSESGAIVGRFLKFDKIMTENIQLIERLQAGSDRDLEQASHINPTRNQAYKTLTDAMEVFITDGNAQGVFHASNPKEKAAFIAFGLLGLRGFCNNELKKKATLYSCMESILGADLKTYLKLAA